MRLSEHPRFAYGASAAKIDTDAILNRAMLAL
jgi:hypothetical protein